MSLKTDIAALISNLSKDLDAKRRKRIELDVEIRELQGVYDSLVLLLNINNKEKEEK